MSRQKLTVGDWQEIYYALGTKLQALEQGRYDDFAGQVSHAGSETHEWAAHLRRIVVKVRQLRRRPKGSNDRSDLKPGEYLLLDPKPVPAFARSISKETRALVLDRNGFTCQMCGAVAGEPHPYDEGRKTRLQIGHIIDKSMGGNDDLSNLRAICSVCNEGAQNLTLDRPTTRKLLIQIRRATSADQLDVLQWLLKKFPDQK